MRRLAGSCLSRVSVRLTRRGRVSDQLPPDLRPGADTASRSDGAVRNSKERMAEAYRDALEQVPASLLPSEAGDAAREGWPSLHRRIPHADDFDASLFRTETARHGGGKAIFFESAVCRGRGRVKRKRGCTSGRRGAKRAAAG